MPDVKVMDVQELDEEAPFHASVMTWEDFNFPPSDLPETDGEPLDTAWHRDAINVLVDSFKQSRGDDRSFYCGGNMFIYYSSDQAEAAMKRDFKYRGPDFFVVLDVDGRPQRGSWRVWEERGRYPNVIIELLSPSTAKEDLTTKKKLYEQTFRTPEYYCYDPDNQELLGWRLTGGRYEPIRHNEHGRLWSHELNLWIGRWQGEYQQTDAVWLRFFHPNGDLVETFTEAERRNAEAERRNAEAERQRANALQQALAELQDKLAAAGIDPGA
jgi:Uma2 family endonuclease